MVGVVTDGRVVKSLKEFCSTVKIAIHPRRSIMKGTTATDRMCEAESATAILKTMMRKDKRVYKRRGKWSRTRRKPLPRVCHKSPANVEDHTGVILKYPVEMMQDCTRGFRAHVKRELEHAVVKTTRSWIFSNSNGQIVADGDVRMVEVNVIFGKLFKLVKHLEAVTGTTCPHPAVLGGFLLGQESNKEWHDMVWAGFVGDALKVAVDAYVMDVAVRAGSKQADGDEREHLHHQKTSVKEKGPSHKAKEICTHLHRK